MKLHPIVAVLALCSAAGAAPLSRPDRNTDSPVQAPEIVQYDLAFSEEIPEQSLPDETQPPSITTGIATDFALTDEEIANRDPEFASVPGSEPPPVATIALGCTFLGVAGIIRRTRTERRRARRRTLVHIRAIIAAR